MFENFTPISGLIGGVMIGAASGFLMLFVGRICGISTIADGVMTDDLYALRWRSIFILGLVCGALVVDYLSLGPPRGLEITHSIPLLIGAGFLVGLGAKIGGGCTSGHGVCGLSLMSVRSFASVVTFYLTAVLTTFLIRHVVIELT